MMRVLLVIAFLLGSVNCSFGNNNWGMNNPGEVELLDDNHYQFQQYALLCTREWTATGYSWCILSDAEDVLPQEIWESFMQQAAINVWSGYNYEQDSYVIWKEVNGHNTYTLKCMCEEYYSGLSFTTIAQYTI